MRFAHCLRGGRHGELIKPRATPSNCAVLARVRLRQSNLLIFLVRALFVCSLVLHVSSKLQPVARCRASGSANN